MKFNVLGPLEVLDDAGAPVTVGTPGQRQTLTALLLLAGPPSSRERLAGALWGEDHLPADPRLALRTRIFELRGMPAVKQRLETLSGGYRLRVEPGELDASNFASLAEHGRAALVGGDPEGAARLLQQAVNLWRDPPWPDLPRTPMMQTAADRLNGLRAGAVEALLEARLKLGQHRDIIGPLREIVAADPLHEHAWALLMTALHHAGHTADALAAYGNARVAIIRELGQDPGPELQRVQQQILAGDPALGAGPPAPAAVTTAPQPSWMPVYQLPAPPADFTGRAAETEALGGYLAGAEMTVTVLTGPAGAGKTAVALYCGQRFHESFPGGQLYARLGGCAQKRDPQDVLAEILRALGVAPARVPAAGPERAALYRSLLAYRQVLVVADGAVSAAQVRPLLPGTAGSAVLVTSRSRLAGLEAARVVEVGEMPPDDSVTLLSRIAGPGKASRDAAPALAAIAASCGGLPLALRIAGARLAAEPALTPAALAGALAGETRRLRELTTGDLSVLADLAAAEQVLDERARRAFRLISLHPTGDIPGWLIPVLLNNPEAAEVAEAIVSAGLLTAVPEPGDPTGRYRMHSLAHLYAAWRLAATTEDTAAEIAAAAARMFAAWLDLADHADRQLPRHPHVPAPAGLGHAPVALPGGCALITAHAPDWCAQEAANLQAVTVRACTHDHLLAGGLAARQFSSQIQRGSFDSARQLWESVAAAATHAGDTLAAAQARYRLAVIALAADGRDRHAVRVLTGCLPAFAVAQDRRGLADAHHLLAVCAVADDDPAAARRHAEQGLDAAVQEADPRLTFLNMSALGTVLAGLGHTAKGVACCEEALSIATGLREPAYVEAAGRALDRARILAPDTWGWRINAAAKAGEAR